MDETFKTCSPKICEALPSATSSPELESGVTRCDSGELRTVTHGSLFTGIGGIDLGFERAGIKTVWQVEIDPFCRKVLERHFPDARRYHNIKRVKQFAPVDIVSGGFPCQDISSAGRMRGIDGKRSGLWSEMWRVIRIVRPRFVVVENVAALLNRGIERVVGNLAESGYDCEWDCLPAIAFGAPHRRDRIFLVAYPAQRGLAVCGSASRSARHALLSREGLADASCCGRQESTQGVAIEEPKRRSGNSRQTMADSPRLLEGREIERAIGERIRQSGESINLADTNGNNGHGRSGAVQVGRIGSAEEIAQHDFGPGTQWLVEPSVGRVAHGVPARVDRLKGLGNAVVPQIAEWIGRRIVAAVSHEQARAVRE